MGSGASAQQYSAAATEGAGKQPLDPDEQAGKKDTWVERGWKAYDIRIAKQRADFQTDMHRRRAENEAMAKAEYEATIFKLNVKKREFEKERGDFLKERYRRTEDMDTRTVRLEEQETILAHEQSEFAIDFKFRTEQMDARAKALDEQESRLREERRFFADERVRHEGDMVAREELVVAR